MKKILMLFIAAAVVSILGIYISMQSVKKPAVADRAAMNDAVMTAIDSNSREEEVEILTLYLQQEFERIEHRRNSAEQNRYIFSIVSIGSISIAGISLYLYCQKSILNPFQKLQKFARNVAEGNLDIPLEMDRYGRFGAFTESFDLMREELKIARENERIADRSKKELVASLSHDIKTPVASIKAATELMLVTATGEKERKQLERIGAKADQINSLVTDLFHATLEELQALSVDVNEISSSTITELIRNADYKGNIKQFMIPSCIILADRIRLQQIFDNIIGNSYKYAGTEIEIKAVFEAQYLVVEIADFGSGVAEDDLPFLMNKFYRGKNTEDKSGYGLGLYITKYLLNQMSGEVLCENKQGRFTVKLMLHLA